MPEASSELVHAPDEQTTRWIRLSLKTLMVVTALVAVYFAGRASTRPHWFAPQAGTWRLVMTSGHERPVTLSALPSGGYALDLGSSNLGGKYHWKAGKLVVDVPNDPRYVGLVWQWDGDDLVLVAEPPGRPAGPSYVGARLEFVSSDISTATQKSVAVVPSRVAVQQAKQRGGVARLQDQLPAFRPTAWRDPEPGEWELTLPAGFKRKATLKKLPDGKFEFSSGGVFDGTYEARSGKLEVVKPEDKRMIGLAWARENDELVLVSEPSPPPTGAQYLGARLRRVEKMQ